MKWITGKERSLAIYLATLASLLLAGCGGGGGGGGPSVKALPQTLSFAAPPALPLGGTASVSATASSGLAATFSSTTQQICSVDSTSGLVSAITPGTCIIAANQAGNSTFAPAPQVTQSIPVTVIVRNQTISFGPAPPLTIFSTASVTATATSGLAPSYSSTTPGVCSVDSSTGVVSALAAGNCIIAADQAGNAEYFAAPQVTQTLTVTVPIIITVPGVPTGVTATAGDGLNTVSVSIGATSSGGSPITNYTVTSSPAGITGTGAAPPIVVSCGASCNGYAFRVFATNVAGDGTASAPADVVTSFDVVETFHEPDTQPRDSIFKGSFTFNSTTGTVSNLTGQLSESMTGDPLTNPTFDYGMIWLTLTHQLSSANNPALGGLLVTTFLNSNTNTFTTGFGGDGWTPQAGVAVGGIYYGWPGPGNPGNAYAMIFVNTTVDPRTPLTQAQIDKLAYADCAPGGMMGAVCMTGTSVAGYGAIGTMSGYPVAQIITKQ